MAASRGDECFAKSDISKKNDTEINNPVTQDVSSYDANILIDANGDQDPLMNLQSNDNDIDDVRHNQSIFEESEQYTGFQKITTIPAATLSIVAGFIMIASVWYRMVWKI